MIANQRGQRIEAPDRLGTVSRRKRHPVSTYAQIIEDTTPESGGVKHSMQVRSPARTVGGHSPVKAVGGLPTFVGDPEHRPRGLGAFGLSHMNLVTHDFFITIDAQGTHLFCGLPRFKRGCALEETQSLHRSCTRFNPWRVEQLPAQHLKTTADS